MHLYKPLDTMMEALARTWETGLPLREKTTLNVQLLTATAAEEEEAFASMTSEPEEGNAVLFSPAAKELAATS